MISVAIHASLRWVSWKPAIGLPNMIRCLEYCSASSNTHCARPITPHAMPYRACVKHINGDFSPFDAGRIASRGSSTSWKISSAADAVGTIEQDRITAVAGTIGKAPRMIPVDVKIKTSRGQERAFSFRMVDDELFSPVLAYVALASVLQSNERAFGTSTIRVDARLSLTGKREVRVEDLFTQEQPAMQAAGLVAAPLAYLMTNDFEPVRVELFIICSWPLVK